MVTRSRTFYAGYFGRMWRLRLIQPFRIFSPSIKEGAFLSAEKWYSYTTPTHVAQGAKRTRYKKKRATWINPAIFVSIDRPAWQARGDTEVCQGGRFGLQRPKRGWIKDDIRVLFSVRYSIRERMNISSHLLCQSFEFFSFTPFGAVMLIFSFFCCWPLINKSKKKKKREVLTDALILWKRKPSNMMRSQRVVHNGRKQKRNGGIFSRLSIDLSSD